MGADPARSAPQPAPQTIRAAGAACAVAMQSPAGAKRRAARKLPNIDRDKWGQHLIPYTLGLYVTCVCPNSNPVVAAMCWLGSAFGRERVLDDDGPSHPGPHSQDRQRRPWVSRPPPRLLLLRPRSPPAAQAHILSPRRNGDIETGRSHTCSNPSVLTRLVGT
jgi:hypothetical protein